MGTTSDHVNVSITFSTTSVERQGFGVPLLAAYIDPATQSERVLTYSTDTWDEDLVAAGHAVYSPVYKMARAIASADPKPGTFKLGRLSAHHQTITLEVTSATEDDVLTVTITDELGAEQTIERTVPSSSSLSAEATAFAALIDAAFTNLDAAAVAELITCDVVNDGDVFYYQDWDNLNFTDITPDAGISADLTAIEAEDDSWYMAAFDVSSQLMFETEGCGWFESKRKLCMVQSQDSDILTSASDDFYSTIKTANRLRTIPIHCGKQLQSEYPAAAWMSVCLPKDPGSQTWCFKQPSGITPAGVNSTAEGYLKAKATNYVVQVAGVSFFRWGTVAKGTYIDLMRLADWTEARIEENIFLALTSEDKIPYTDLAYGIYEDIIYGVYKEGAANGGYILDSFVFTTPEPTDENDPSDIGQSEANEAIRKMTGIKFSGAFQGATHEVVISGKIG
jgi:hypothetical protein